MAAQVAPAAAPADSQPRGPPPRGGNLMAAPRGPAGPPRNIPVVDREKVRGAIVPNYSNGCFALTYIHSILKHHV